MKLSSYLFKVSQGTTAGTGLSVWHKSLGSQNSQTFKDLNRPIYNHMQQECSESAQEQK